MKFRGLTFRLILLVFTTTALLFSFLFLYSYRFSRQTIERNAEENARELVRSTINLIESVLNPVEKIPETVSTLLRISQPDQSTVYEWIIEIVMNNPEIYGSTIAFEPYALVPDAYFFAPYYYQSETRVEMNYLGGEEYYYFVKDWYQIPKLLNRPLWSEPYYDEGGGNIMMSTYSAPFYRFEDGRRLLWGIVTADVALTWLQEVVSSIQIFQTGYGFLLSQNGTILTHPNASFIMNESIFSLAEAQEDLALREVGRKMIRGETGFTVLENLFSGKTSLLAYAPVPSSGWSLGVIFPQDELLADVTRLNRIVLILAGVFFAVLFGTILFISRSVTRPIRILAQATDRVAHGQLDVSLPTTHDRDEVGVLTSSFVAMVQDLKKYIVNLQETTAAKERIESELKIAHEIQMSLVPKIFPPFPDRVEFELYAVMEPAREVGGDLYDFFFLDDHHLCFLVGDVSGKGVPASLFMAVTKTLFKSAVKETLEPWEILSRVNRDLSEENEASMFITVFCGIIDLRTGEVQYSNGGHNPPVSMPQQEPAHFTEIETGTVLGIMPDFTFPVGRDHLEPGDRIILYTDGVTEAFDRSGNIFTGERFLEIVQDCSKDSMKGLVDTVIRSIHTFSEGVEQSDDITILAFRYYGPGGKP